MRIAAWDGVRKSATRRELDDKIYDEMPPIPAKVVPARKMRLALAEDLDV